MSTVLTDDLIAKISAEVTTKPISLVYRGQHGCACGCIGNYRDTLTSITRARNDILALVADISGEATLSQHRVRVTAAEVMPGVFASVEYVGQGHVARVVTVYTDGRTAE